MKISFWKILSLAGLLAEELSEAAADNKITVAEALHVVEKICKSIGIDFDKDGFDVVKEKFVKSNNS